MKKRIVMLLLSLCSCIAAQENQSSKYYFSHLSVDKGLSQSSVLCILQDKIGYMWFGTKEGLNRYDGVSFRTFTHNPLSMNGLGNNVINSMYEDLAGNIWLGTDGGIYIYKNEDESFEKFNIKNSDNQTITKPVYYIAGDDDGNIWFAVESQGMFCYRIDKKELKHYSIKLNDKANANVVSFCIDQQKTIWLGLGDKGLFYTNNLFKDIIPFTEKDSEDNMFENEVIFKIIPENKNNLYIGSSRKGFTKINLINKHTQDLLSGNSKTNNTFVRCVLKSSPNEFWIGTENGIYIYNSNLNSYTKLKHDSDDDYSLSDNAIYSLYKDREDAIWVGSYFGGINYYPPKYTYFEKYYPLIRQNSISGKIVREFCQDKNGNIWIGTEDAGLNLFNPRNGTFTQFKDDNLYHNIHALCLDDDKLWVGTFSMGLYRIDLKTNRIEKHFTKNTDAGSLVNNNVFAMYKTSLGELYVGTSAGLNIYNRSTQSFDKVEYMKDIFVFDIFEDSKGDIWFASYVSGLFKYSPRDKSWKHYVSDSTKPNSLPYDKVISIFEDSNHKIWITTQGGGFCSFDSKTETFIQASNDKHILHNHVIYKIIEDDSHNFWLTTNRGLYCYDPRTDIYKTYTTANGLLGNQFNYSSGLKTADGKIYIGGIDGFIAFNPTTFAENNTKAPIVITDFFLFNKHITAKDPNTPLTKNISLVEELNLKYDQNSFSFNFASLSYIASDVNSMVYKLEGFDKEWYAASSSQTASYTNLKPGNYVFSVKYTNSDKEIKKIKITIDSPFWQTPLAFILYFVLIAGSAGFVIRNYQKRLQNKQKYQLIKIESQKEKEIYEAKVEFFTNVAHEIRTPLTLIKGPLENVMKKEDLDDNIKDDLNVMEKNTTRLLNLTNQLLDFRKTEEKGFSVNFTQINISELIRETHTRFYPTAKDLKLVFDLSLPENDLYAAVDKEAFTKILSNLFTNAIKNSNSFISITLREVSEYNPEMFSISVTNDGDTIPTEMREEIFKPFVRLENSSGRKWTSGTGIGLTLVKSLVELHTGRLFIEDKANTCFCVEIPLKLQNASDILSKPESDKQLPLAKNTQKEDKTTILVVEDDSEMSNFVSKQLHHKYNIIQAGNGIEALQVMDAQNISLIVSDVMMPEMDGFELCKRCKSDIAYSHIPLILLTAKVSLQSKIEGIELGADDYIEKPFSSEYLLARISNLLASQEKKHQSFISSPFTEAKSIALSKTDEDFLDRLTELINKNISEPDFNIDTLAEQMHMSRSSLHRKIKGLSQLTPNEYIQLERLKKAAQLIRSGDYRINEVCYIVGFSSSSYFAKCFQKQFGVLPKDFGK